MKQRNRTFYIIVVLVVLSVAFIGCNKENNGGGASGNNPTGDWVDMGLPSGLLWCSHNVGAYTPEECGGYYAWGETQTKYTYNWSTYQYGNDLDQITKYCNASQCGYNNYTDHLTILVSGDDAAAVHMGNGARIPTKEEWQELIYNTTITWTTQNGVAGCLFTASNGNSIFLPAGGNRWNSELVYDGSEGYYWSSSLYTDNPNGAWSLYFEAGSYYTRPRILHPRGTFYPLII